MKRVRPPHPFPARMAPDIAVVRLGGLPPGSTVLDPMAGSGTVLRHASEAGHNAIGFDMDPLATLMARVWTTPVDTQRVRELAALAVAKAKATAIGRTSLRWQCQRETADYVRFWFGADQARDLQRLAHRLSIMHRHPESREGAHAVDCLRLALSKVIVTKDKGASLARDVSHSRPHKVMEHSDFDVYPAYVRAVERLASDLDRAPPPGHVRVCLGDARKLDLPNESVDYVLTSPPYLNAIDYMRGHRLALVWLGHSLATLREIRRRSIGAERAADGATGLVTEFGRILRTMGDVVRLPGRYQQMILRYACDIYTVISEVRRVTKRGGRATFVVGNSCLKGIFVKNSEGVKEAANMVGLRLQSETERDLPVQSRYLPPPDSDMSTLRRRMRTESVLEFTRA